MGDVKFSEETTDDKPTSSRTVAYLIDAAVILMALLLVFLVRWGIYDALIVTTGSMEPTVMPGDRLLVDHRSSLHGTWQRGDVVAFHTPETWSGAGEILTKRVLGLPGETIEIRQGKTYANREAVPEPYLKEPPEPKDMPPVKLGPDQYFVMGDNRNHSDDSREQGPIADANIIGRAIYRLAPWGRRGRL